MDSSGFPPPPQPLLLGFPRQTHSIHHLHHPKLVLLEAAEMKVVVAKVIITALVSIFIPPLVFFVVSVLLFIAPAS